MEIQIVDIPTTARLSLHIPEFEAPYGKDVYYQRLSGKNHLLLAASIDGLLVGFKAGYESDEPTHFYSWMGGVLPEYRKLGVATALAAYQEKWVIEQGYSHILMKTRNQNRNMLLFCLSRGFQITAVRPAETLAEHRIYLQKELKKS